MSDLSKVKNSVEAFLAHALSFVPAEAQPSVQAAAADVHAAIAETESAGVSTAGSLVTAEAPTLETMIAGGVPAEFRPIVSLGLQFGLAELVSRLQAIEAPSSAASK